MVDKVSIKGINNELFVIINDRYDFSSCLIELKEKLTSLNSHSELCEVNFSFERRFLNECDLRAFFSLILSFKNILVKSIQSLVLIPSVNEMINRNIHNGENLILYKETLIVGNMNSGAKIMSTKNLYIMKSVCGHVELVNKNNYIVCNGLKNATITIGDKTRHNMTNSSLAMVYYQNNNIEVKNI